MNLLTIYLIYCPIDVLIGPKASPSRHRHLIEGHVYNELIRERHL
jgi:hypothetical protein